MKKQTVAVENIKKSFHDGNQIIHILKGITMDVTINEMLMIIGPSGCGKTTLISIMAGTLHCDEGSIEILGRNLQAFTDEEITQFRRDNIGFLFQKFNLMSSLTCGENVALPLLIKEIDHVTALKKAKRALEEIGQGDKFHRFPNELSSGQQQLVAAARAIVHNPSLIICDEPTSSLDPENGRHVMSILSELSTSAERSVIVVSHDHRIFTFADRIVSIEGGVVKEVSSEKE